MTVLWVVMMALAFPFSLLCIVLGFAAIALWIEAFEQFGPVAALGIFYFGPVCTVLFGMFPWLCVMNYLMWADR